MKDTDKHELTEKLKVIETKIYDLKIDLKGVESKLNNAYRYEEELIERQSSARKKTNELQVEFFKMSGEISELYDKMKYIFDLFTGNHYHHIKE